MAAIPEESSVTYQQLSDLEREFDDVEVEISQFSATSPTHASFAVSYVCAQCN